MMDIRFLKDRIIIDGHAETKEQCETITLLCDNLAKSKDFKTVRYENGYAEFEKVKQADGLKFPPVTITINGGEFHFCVLNAYYNSSYYGSPTSNSIIYCCTVNNEFTQSFVFTSNNTSFDSIHIIASKDTPDNRKMYYVANGIETLVYHNDVWTNEAYKILSYETQSVREGIHELIAGISGGFIAPQGTFKVLAPLSAEPTHAFTFSQFKSNGITFCSIAWTLDDSETHQAEVNYSGPSVNNVYTSTKVYQDGWVDQNYQTITIPANTYMTYDTIDRFDERLTAVSKQQIDLSTLSGWANLTSGQHSITVKAKANGYNNSELSNSITVVKGSVVDGTWKATVSNLGSSNPENVSFELPASNIKRPWSEITFNGDTFIKIQKMYRKVNSTSSNQITSFSISNTKIDNTYQIYPCFVDESGNELDYILIGKYMSNSTTECNSISSNGVVQELENARNLARQRGTGYQLMDWRIHKLWQDLVICVYGKLNINDGTGVLIDKLGVYWGETNDSWLSSAQFIDGCAITSYGNYLYSNYPSKYVNNPYASTDGYVEIEDYKLSYSNKYSNNENIHALGYSTNHPFFNYPKLTNKDNAYTTYYCEAFGLPSTSPAPIASYVGAASAGAGAFSFYCKAMFGVSFGVRLCYRPIAS